MKQTQEVSERRRTQADHLGDLGPEEQREDEFPGFSSGLIEPKLCLDKLPICKCQWAQGTKGPMESLLSPAKDRKGVAQQGRTLLNNNYPTSAKHNRRNAARHPTPPSLAKAERGCVFLSHPAEIVGLSTPTGRHLRRPSWELRFVSSPRQHWAPPHIVSMQATRGVVIRHPYPSQPGWTNSEAKEGARTSTFAQ